VLRALAALQFLPMGPALAEPSPTTLPRRIDVHFHYLPSDYLRAAEAAGYSKPDGMPAFPQWDAESAVAMMDRQNIGTGVLSVSSPGVHFGNVDAARKLARRVNEDGAQAVKDHPGRFGLFASLPVPDVDGSLEEIAHAFDVLGADGVVLLTNQGGVYLGDARLDPIFAELDRRHAVVFIHPTSPFCPGCSDLALGYPRPMLEFMFDTTRAVTNMLFAGTFDRFPNIRLIVPHAGAALPVLADRILALSSLAKPIPPNEFFAKLRSLYYDIAGYPIPRQLASLLQIAEPSHILYGSDWPFTPERLIDATSKNLSETLLLTDAMREQVCQKNAMGLFPRLRTL
jgi:6-methylsalicylate decarboxylase